MAQQLAGGVEEGEVERKGGGAGRLLFYLSPIIGGKKKPTAGFVTLTPRAANSPCGGM